MSAADEILPGIWLGDMNAAKDASFFKKFNIKAVINCTPDVPCAMPGVDYLQVKIDDSLQKKDIDKMKQAIPVAVSFLHQKHDIEKKTILIHCHAGMQRSATIVTAYLCKYYNLTLDQAINHILSRRRLAFHYGKHLNFYESLIHFKK